MGEWIERVPLIDRALLVAVLVATGVALASRRRGGHFRGLPGWVGFWICFAAILTCLSRGRPWLSFPPLMLLMYAGLRTYFSVAPVRPRDRYAILAAYAAIPLALYPGWVGSEATFLATVPIVLFLLFPVLLSAGQVQDGLLDSMGRLLLGVLLFVFCAAHLGLLVHPAASGRLELFGLLVLGAELPQRMAGRFGRGSGVLRPALGVAGGILLAVALGFHAGAWCGLPEEDAARAGALVAIAVTMGAVVAEAVARDLDLGTPSARFGRGAFLDRAIPALYAAPVFFHYLNHFA